MKKTCLILFIAFLFLSFFQPLEIGDVWWHLATGQWITEHKQLPSHDIFSFDGQRYPWMATQWLGSTILFHVHQFGGNVGLKIFRALFFIAILALFFMRFCKKQPFVFLLFIVFLIAQALGTRCLLRPFIFNFLFIQLFLIFLFKHQKSARRRNLFVLPFLGIIWANIHLGSFVYGLILIGIFLCAAIAKYVVLRKQGDLFQNKRRVKHLAITLLGYLACFLVTPYGIEGAIYPFKAFLDPTFIYFYKLNRGIAELQAPGYLFTLRGLWFWVLSCLTLFTIVSNKERRTISALLFLTAFCFFFLGQRASVFFAIICGYIIAMSFKKEYIQSISRALRVIGIILFALLVGLQAGRLLVKEVYVRGMFTKVFMLEEYPNNPGAGIAVLKEHNITGKVFNYDMFGGHILWKAYPHLRLFVDGRQANFLHFNQYTDVLKDPKKFWPKAEKEHGFTIALLNAANYHTIPFIKHLNALSDWQLILIDGACVVFVKRGVFSLPDKLSSFESNLKEEEVTVNAWQSLKEAAVQYSLARPSIFLKEALVYMDVLKEGATLFGLGYKGAGIAKVAQSLAVKNSAISRKIAYIIINKMNKE